MSLRLSLAFESGGLTLPDGQVVVLHPPTDADLSGLPVDRVTIVQPHYTDHVAWTARGFSCLPQLDGHFSAAIVFLPRAKAQARALVATAAACADLVVVDGLKSHGVDSLIKELRKRVDISSPIAKAHGKLVWFVDGDFDDWVGHPVDIGGFVTAPGVFSADGVDPASALLAEVLPQKIGKTVVDLGAGWGFLSAEILTRPEVEVVRLVEADHIALDCARQNIPDPRAQFHWANAITWTPPAPVDAVVMNPPFHKGRAADTGLGQAFINAAARMLKPAGTLWMVANRHLPYEAALRGAFREGDELAGNTRFKLFRAARPSRAGR